MGIAFQERVIENSNIIRAQHIVFIYDRIDVN